MSIQKCILDFFKSKPYVALFILLEALKNPGSKTNLPIHPFICRSSFLGYLVLIFGMNAHLYVDFLS